MTRSTRFTLLISALAATLALTWLPGRAQEGVDPRYVFADTTLLRDTLGLSFTRLFPLADSLQVTPDSLRAWSVRWRLPLARLVALTDSLRVPVDSVGPLMERERLNPLAGPLQNARTFRYASTYEVGRSVSVWGNTGEFRLDRGPLYVRNATTVTMDRTTSGGQTTLHQNRLADTEAGWRFSRDVSLGARARLEGFLDTRSGEDLTKNDFQTSLRSRHRPRRGVTSELNLLTGVVDVSQAREVKRGLSSDLNGKLNWTNGRWLSHDLSGQVTGNLARTGLPGTFERADTRDYSGRVSGALGLFTSSPVGLNLNYSWRRSNIASPAEALRSDTLITPGDSLAPPDTSVIERRLLRIQRNTVANGSVDAALRLRLDGDRQLGLTGRFGTSDNAVTTALNSLTSRRDLGVGADARWKLAGFNLISRLGITWSESRYPTRSLTGGYGDSTRLASFDAELTRNVGQRVVVKATSRVSLSASRSYLIGSYPNPPVDRDNYSQGWRLEGNYTRSDRFNTTLGLEVGRTLGINLPAASAASNQETRTYRADWRWTYRLLQGLTATQRNSLISDYIFYRTGDRNRLHMNYQTLTSLNAVLSPRFTMTLTHDARYQPAGTYRRLDDGYDYLERSDESEAYALRASFSYAPSPMFSLVLNPDYSSDVRSSNRSGSIEPTSLRRGLRISGGANVNMALGRRARLTGNINRSFASNRTTTYEASGEPLPSPRSENDFWNGSLQLTVDL